MMTKLDRLYEIAADVFNEMEERCDLEDDLCYEDICVEFGLTLAETDTVISIIDNDLRVI